MKKIKSAMLILMVAIGFASFVSCGNNKNAQPNDAKAVAEALEEGTVILELVDGGKIILCAINVVAIEVHAAAESSNSSVKNFAATPPT